MKEVNYDRILKECFWDYNLTKEDIADTIKSDDYRKKKKLFEKIIYNSTDSLKDLQIFSKQDLKKMFEDLHISYNKNYINKKVKVLKYLLYGDMQDIEDLQWRKF